MAEEINRKIFLKEFYQDLSFIIFLNKSVKVVTEADYLSRWKRCQALATGIWSDGYLRKIGLQQP